MINKISMLGLIHCTLTRWMVHVFCIEFSQTILHHTPIFVVHFVTD